MIKQLAYWFMVVLDIFKTLLFHIYHRIIIIYWIIQKNKKKKKENNDVDLMYSCDIKSIKRKRENTIDQFICWSFHSIYSVRTYIMTIINHHSRHRNIFPYLKFRGKMVIIFDSHKHWLTFFCIDSLIQTSKYRLKEKAEKRDVIQLSLSNWSIHKQIQ